jgi:hypothetical protein
MGSGLARTVSAEAGTSLTRNGWTGALKRCDLRYQRKKARAAARKRMAPTTAPASAPELIPPEEEDGWLVGLSTQTFCAHWVAVLNVERVSGRRRARVGRRAWLAGHSSGCSCRSYRERGLRRCHHGEQAAWVRRERSVCVSLGPAASGRCRRR